MLCNVVLRGLAESIHSTKLEAGRDYLPIVISLDPKETPDEAARRQATLLELAGIKNRAQWPYLVGNVAPLAAALDFHYSWDARTEQFIHPAEVFVISPDGHVTAELRGVTYPELAAAVQGEDLPADTSAILRCFHYDPALARYRGRLQNFFRLGAATVFFVLLAGVGAVAWRRR
jgi:protein SCO1/2